MHRRSTLIGLLPALLAGAVIAICAGCGTSSAGALAREHTAPSARAASASGAGLSLPAPSGASPVGTIAVAVPDPSRGGETMVQLFYPTLVRHGRPAPYMPPKTASLAASTLHVPPAVIASIVTHSFAGPPAAPGRHPVVLFSPGLTELRSDDTALCTELASHGFVVVAIDHVHETAIVEFPNGRVIPGTFADSPDPQTSGRLRAAAVRARVKDVAAVLRALPRLDQRGLLRGRLDLGRVGMFGFSLGGATADEAMHALPQIRAGVNLDGSLYGNSLRRPLDRPFLFLARDRHTTATDPSWQRGWAMLRGWRREIHLVGSGHGDFTDLAGLIAEFTPGYRDPSEYYGPIPPTRATAAIRQVLAAFFGRFLNGDRAPERLLDTPGRVNRYLLRLR